jgi:YggT family protein
MVEATLIIFVDLLLLVLSILIIIRMLASWLVPPTSTSRIMQTLVELTEPVIAPVRRVMPKTGAIDISPLVTLILIDIIRTLFFYLLSGGN